jgi:hypothetical protein
VREHTGETGERSRLQRRNRYHNDIKTNPELMEKRRQNGRSYTQQVKERQQQEWEEMNAGMSQLKHVLS